MTISAVIAGVYGQVIWKLSQRKSTRYGEMDQQVETRAVLIALVATLMTVSTAMGAAGAANAGAILLPRSPRQLALEVAAGVVILVVAMVLPKTIGRATAGAVWQQLGARLGRVSGALRRGKP